MINILQVIGSGEIGGANSFVLELLRAIDRSRFDVGVCCVGQSGPAVDEMRDLGFAVLTLNNVGHLGPMATIRYLHEIRRRRYEIVHAHIGGRMPRFVGAIAGCRTVAHVHALPEPRGDELRRRGSAARFALDTSYGVGSDSIVACCREISDMLTKTCPGLASKVSTIYSGVDLARWHPICADEQRGRKSRVGIPVEGIVVGFAGRLVRHKGLDDIVEAAGRSIARLRHIHFVVLGEGALRPALERRAAPLGERFRFVGRQASTEWLPLFDILVLPSESEALPFCILEAMACGKPVVASRVGGVPEAVIDGVTGMLISTGDPEGLGKALDILALSSDTRRQMGLAGRARAERYFDSRETAQRVEELYVELL